MTRTTRIQITGRAESRPVLPPLLAEASRGLAEGDSDFLPAQFLQAVVTIDVSGAARSTEAGARQQDIEAQGGSIVVLELADGSTLITSADRLLESLHRSHPEWWPEGADPDVLPFEKMRAQGAAPQRGFSEAVGGLVSKVFALTAGDEDPILGEARRWLEEHGGKAVELGLTWLGTKALMWAVESRLFKKHPGLDRESEREATGWLYAWVGSSGKAAQDFALPDASELGRTVADRQPMLVFVHGTGSTSLGSFGDLHGGDASLWTSLQDHYKGCIYAFEHRTLSASPIENALDLARALPQGAIVDLVSHSRGGMVADLLCLSGFDGQIMAYGREKNLVGLGEGNEKKDNALADELDAGAYGPQRQRLVELAAELQRKNITVRRYVRAASPANGTTLASGNFDLFLSGLLSLIGKVPFFYGNPYYAAFKRIVVEIAKNRTNPRRVPGIEAMLPDSPMARLLHDAPVKPGIEMGVIAGDIEGGNLLVRMGVLLTDFLLFDREDNDLVVNTTAMLAGVAPRANARVLFDRGADVSHFRYFTNVGTRTALRDWLVAKSVDQVDVFDPLPSPEQYDQALAKATREVAGADDRPVVVILPGVMGSLLRVNGKDRVWFDPLDIAVGGLSKVAWGKPGIEADELFAMFYGKLAEELAGSHRVERFPYDWRQPLDVLGERLGEFLDRLLKTTQQPIRLLAHSMGGLVVRACIYRRRPVMDALMARDGARLVFLGTPHQGAHSMVENLIGKGDTLRMLVRLDLKHTMQEVLEIVAGFRGALQLLPRPGFTDEFQGQPGGGAVWNYHDAATWATTFPPLVKDFWFGNGHVGRPDQPTLDAAAWLWAQDKAEFKGGRPSLPRDPDRHYETKSTYVFGVAPHTPCGVRRDGDRLRMVATPHGDGTVSWESGRIDGIGQFLYMPAEHGDLPATKEHFPALVELLTTGATSRLSVTPPATRAVEQAQPVTYDAGPPVIQDADMIGRRLLGGSLHNRVPPRRKRRLEVRVHAKDLRFLNQPILVGHYEQDPIAGPQRVIDRELLDGDLTERHTLGLYAGPLGTATVVLRVPNEAERARGSLRGAVVTGLGDYNGSLGASQLAEAVRAGALRYLLQVVDVLGKNDREVPLSTLLLGYNSSANLTVEGSIEALVRGVMEANERFFETTRLNIRIHRLDIVELYVDTAITAVYVLRRMQNRLAALAARQQTQLVCVTELQRGEGRRQRLFDAGSGSAYWPRLIITAAEQACCEPDDPPAARPHCGEPPRTALADELKFLYVGQRARAETVQQQRQPGLIEQIVRQQIDVKVYSEDVGRMLFQLMVPHEFKDAARQLDQAVLVVDPTTANLPWELMLADDPQRTDGDKRPLALRMRAVRQLTADQFRHHVRQNIERTALVVGNPSVQGYAAAFSTDKAPIAKDPPDLSGAKQEAEAVARLLGAMGYQVTPLVAGERAAQVLAALYRRPWRLLHISAHGVFALPHPDGRYRSGVLLSDGLLITAAEIRAMETVPDLVFLNCCHLGTMDLGRDGNKLAASVAMELIGIGVRCVIVAGWAVDDQGASLFGQTFYENLLRQRRSFGEAVFQARKAVYDARPTDITWGAFQAYGDPAWRAEPRALHGPGGDEEPFASPEELLDLLAGTRAQHSRRGDTMNERDLRAQVESLEAVMKQRCPPGWRQQPAVLSALGSTWLDLQELERARAAFIAAVQTEDRDGTVPIHDIEKLANVEARLAEQRLRSELARNREATQPPAQEPSADALVESAIRRLHELDQLLAPDARRAPHPERSMLLGSAYKRKANLFALRLLDLDRHATPGADRRESKRRRDALGKAMTQALQASAEQYRRDEGVPGSAQFAGGLALNRLALESLTLPPRAEGEDSAIVHRRTAASELARQCRSVAEATYRDSLQPFDAVMQAEAALVEVLVSGDLGSEGEVGEAALGRLVRSYRDTLENLALKPRELDSVVTQMELLSRFNDALWLTRGRVDRWRTAGRLLELRQAIRPGARPRDDRPAGPAGTGTDGRAARAAGARPERTPRSGAAATRPPRKSRTRPKPKAT